MGEGALPILSISNDREYVPFSIKEALTIEFNNVETRD